jgi:hypothetical protein
MSKIAESYDTLYLGISGSARLFSKAAYCFAFPPAVSDGSNFSYTYIWLFRQAVELVCFLFCNKVPEIGKFMKNEGHLVHPSGGWEA